MLIDQLKKEIEAYHPPPASTALHPASTTPASTSPASTSPASLKILVMKEVGNPADYFDKTFAEYQEQGPTSTRYSNRTQIFLYYSNPTRKFLKIDRVASSSYSSHFITIVAMSASQN